MATVKRKIPKKTLRILICAAIAVLLVGAGLLWFFLRPDSPAAGDDTKDPNETGDTPIIETAPLPESTKLSSGKNETFSYDLYEDYAVITKCLTPTGALEIPATLGDKPVMSIGDNAFSQAILLESVSLPEGLRHIGENAFYGCSSLAGITLPESVHEISHYAFADCTSLKEVEMTTGVKTIGTHAFDGTPYVTENTEDFMIAGDGILLAFHGEASSIAIPSDVKKIASLSFCETITSVHIPQNVTEIGGYAFSGCSNLASVAMSDSVKVIGEGAFTGCSSLLGLRLGEGVTEVGHSAFAYCDNLKSVNFPASVEKIGDRLFDQTPMMETIYVTPSSFAEEHFTNSEFASLVVSQEV